MNINLTLHYSQRVRLVLTNSGFHNVFLPAAFYPINTEIYLCLKRLVCLGICVTFVT